MKPERSVFVMIALVLLFMTLVLVMAVHGHEHPDAGCKTEFGNAVECPNLTRRSKK
jgi:hypothetical protein